jgi:hypothetical protein
MKHDRTLFIDDVMQEACCPSSADGQSAEVSQGT